MLADREAFPEGSERWVAWRLARRAAERTGWRLHADRSGRTGPDAAGARFASGRVKVRKTRPDAFLGSHPLSMKRPLGNANAVKGSVSRICAVRALSRVLAKNPPCFRALFGTQGSDFGQTVTYVAVALSSYSARIEQCASTTYMV